MTSIQLPKLDKAIMICYYRTGRDHLDFGDLKYLLLKKELRRWPSKEKKKLYQKWERELTDVIEKKWEPPLKNYDYDPPYLHKVLGQLVRDGMLCNQHNSYYHTPKGILEAVNSNLFYNIGSFPPEASRTIFDKKLTLYGILQPLKEEKNKKLNDEISLFESKILELAIKYKDIEKNILDINKLQIEIMLNAAFNEIKNGEYSKKDKQYGFKFLELLFSASKDKHHIFKWVQYKNGFSLRYIPENYSLDRTLCKVIANIEYYIVNYFLPKPLIFTYEPDMKDITPMEIYEKYNRKN